MLFSVLMKAAAQANNKISKYEGGMENGKRNGKGTLYYEDGGKYTGNWVRNNVHG